MVNGNVIVTAGQTLYCFIRFSLEDSRADRNVEERINIMLEEINIKHQSNYQYINACRR